MKKAEDAMLRDEGRDLPTVQTELAAYLDALRHGRATDELTPTKGLIVAKGKIAANGDYNLIGERHREGNAAISAFEQARLRDVCEVITKGTTPTTAGFNFEENGINFVKIESVSEDGTIIPSKLAHISEAAHNALRRSQLASGDVLFSIAGAMGRSAVIEHSLLPANTNQALAIIRLDRRKASPNYVSHLLRSARIFAHVESIKAGVAQYNLSLQQVGDIKIPLPPLEVQKEIVAEIEGYQKVINGAHAVLDHYRPHIPIDPAWPVVELGEVIEDKPKNGYSGKPVDRITGLKVLTLSATTSGKLDASKFKYLDEAIPENAACRCRKGDIYLQRGNTAELVGTAALFDRDDRNFIYPDLMIRVRANEAKIGTSYLLTALQSQPVREFLTRNAVGAAGSMPKINQGIVERVPIPLPPLATQRAIVAEIEAEQKLVAANRELITRFEQKIQATLARIWGDEKPAAAYPEPAPATHLAAESPA